MNRRPDPEVVAWLRAELQNGPRNVVDVDRAARGTIANRVDLLRAALALRVRMTGPAATRQWSLPKVVP
jgi:hypothetical protein